MNTMCCSFSVLESELDIVMRFDFLGMLYYCFISQDFNPELTNAGHDTSMLGVQSHPNANIKFLGRHTQHNKTNFILLKERNH